MKRSIMIVLLLAGCACTQEEAALADLREAGAEPAAIEAAESAVGDCEERVVQIAAIVAKIVAAALP
jgi:hypothetical protein